MHNNKLENYLSKVVNVCSFVWNE